VKLGRSADWVLLGDRHFVSAFNDIQQLAQREFDKGHVGPSTKLLAAVLTLTQQKIPSDPSSPEFRLGNTLGARFRSWCRAKFTQRYRLFFRYNSAHRVIIYSWFNSTDTLRKSGAETDPYSVFQKMLAAGQPPTDFDELLRYLAK
jgi:toxin YhaV